MRPLLFVASSLALALAASTAAATVTEPNEIAFSRRRRDARAASVAETGAKTLVERTRPRAAASDWGFHPDGGVAARPPGRSGELRSEDLAGVLAMDGPRVLGLPCARRRTFGAARAPVPEDGCLSLSW